jgi:hypothetical protein
MPNMPVTAPEPGNIEHKSQEKEPGNRLILISLGIFLVCYLASILRSAAHTPLWMDEILSVWASRLPSARAIYSALAHGSEYAPPCFPLLLHYFAKVAGGGNLAMRLPSIAGAIIAASCTFVLLRRHLDLARAAFGLCMVLEGIHYFALQIRPYALETACLALAFVFWDDLNRQASVWRAVAIGFLLAIATSLHFYAVLFAPTFGLIELLYALKIRKIRMPIWAAILLGGASIFLWLPLIHQMNRYVANDSGSPAYYAHPTVVKLMDVLCHLFLENYLSILLLLGAMALIGLGAFLGYDSDCSEVQRKPEAGFWAFTLGMIVFPVMVFLFSVLVTKTFNERYAVASVIGMSTLICGCIRPSRFFSLAVPLLLVVAAPLTFSHRENPPNYTNAISELIPPYPIVVADGFQWFPLQESLPPEIRSRIFYVTLPDSIPIGDPTNEHQIERWKTIDPSLQVEDVDQFVQRTPRFYVIDFQTSDDTQAQYLLKRHLIQWASQTDGMVVYKSSTPGDSRNW